MYVVILELMDIGSIQFTITDVRLLQPSKAKLLIDVTLTGIVMDVNASQSWNAYCPMEITEFPMVTDDIPRQL